MHHLGMQFHKTSFPERKRKSIFLAVTITYQDPYQLSLLFPGVATPTSMASLFRVAHPGGKVPQLIFVFLAITSYGTGVHPGFHLWKA